MASGDSLLEMTAQSAAFPTSDFPQFDSRNNHVVLDFDAAANEQCYWQLIMPQNYAGTTGVTVLIKYAMSSATSGNVVIEAAFERLEAGAQDIDSDGFAAVNQVTDAVPGTSGNLDSVSITFTDGADMDSVVAGDTFRLLFGRDGTDASDTASGDLELYAIEIQET